MNKTTPFAFYTLLLAGLYNLIWGAAVIITPQWSLEIFGITDVKYFQLWQCIGMIVGVYGLGYLISATDSNKHWPIVLVGFLGKIFGPIGFAQNLYLGIFPLAFGFNIIFNDLIWWIPFYIVLKDAWNFHHRDSVAPRDLSYELDENHHHVVILMRHLGCTFTRELIINLSKILDEKVVTDKKITLVHMGDDSELRAFLEKSMDKKIVSQISLISDPQKAIYKSFSLPSGQLKGLFGLKELTRGLSATLKGAKLGPLRGDGTQLGGMFAFEGSQLKKSFRCKRASSTFPLQDFLT